MVIRDNKNKGSAWIIDGTDYIFTNKHVADQLFDEKNDLVSSYISFDDYPLESDSQKFEISSLHYIADRNSPDIAIFKIDIKPKDRKQILGLTITQKNTSIKKEIQIAAIGYPSHERVACQEHRNAIKKIFNHNYEIKRIAPAKLNSNSCKTKDYFYHDCSTLGGSSGSPIINIEDGTVIGMYDEGYFGLYNCAVNNSALLEILQTL
ncbi:S1 family peptidase [Ascidiimonas sp. W6]|uniref:S1 family peptidase n=1 Tax=Ascidiimonas meishanensis TaxID=3128903 RepID=UPI0030EECE83